jgi:hypothetical protein
MKQNLEIHYFFSNQPKWNTGDWSNCTALPLGGEGSGQESGSGEGESGGSDVVVAEGTGECPGFMVRNVFCDQVKKFKCFRFCNNNIISYRVTFFQ